MKSRGKVNYILVQPWFSAQGHPAQSLLNLARIVPRARLSCLLVSRFDPAGPFAGMAARLNEIGPLKTIAASGTDLRKNTLRAGLRLLQLSFRTEFRGCRPIFVDCDIFAFLLLGLLGFWVRLAPPAAIILHGPDRWLRYRFWGPRMKSLLGRYRGTIFLRSAPHLAAWQNYCPQGRFALLPPVEGAGTEQGGTMPAAPADGPLMIGMIGQIRPGKNIPALLRLSDQAPEILKVNIRGPLSEQDMPEIMAALQGRRDVRIGYMSEDEMLETAAQQHFLACLFERSWDLNSESATFWLAIKVLRPVLCFEEGWVADMVRRSGGGILIAPDDLPALASKLPRAGTPAYQALQDALLRFRASLEPAALWSNLEAKL